MRASGAYFTDILHYLDEEGELAVELPPPARKLASFLVLLIDAVTAEIPAEYQDTRIRCRKKRLRRIHPRFAQVHR